ncbi:MAG: hypothetical protein JWQ96_2884 [Segetibacter sp.]|nr:hypothetical protein [Segetibacter sp.]
MKRLVVLLSLLATSTYGFCQEGGGPGYNSALGAKLTTGVGVTYKTFVANTKAFEAQAMFLSRGVRFVSLYEFHFYNIAGAPGLGWYIGPGAHIGAWRKDKDIKGESIFDIGIDGVIGLDYKIKNIPINLSLDWQPSYSIIGNAGLQPQFGGLAIRYVLQ